MLAWCVACVCAFRYSCRLLLAVPDWVHVGLQAFINTARKIYEKIEQGVFDVSNEVCENQAICNTCIGSPSQTVLPYMPRLDIDMQVMTDQGVQSSFLQPEPAERRNEHSRSKAFRCGDSHDAVLCSLMASRWAMGQEGRLETQCARERQHPRRAAPAAEAGTCAHKAVTSHGLTVMREAACEETLGACHGNCRLLASGGNGQITLGDAPAVECVVWGSCWSALHGGYSSGAHSPRICTTGLALLSSVEALGARNQPAIVMVPEIFGVGHKREKETNQA